MHNYKHIPVNKSIRGENNYKQSSIPCLSQKKKDLVEFEVEKSSNMEMK